MLLSETISTAEPGVELLRSSEADKRFPLLSALQTDFNAGLSRCTGFFPELQNPGDRSTAAIQELCSPSCSLHHKALQKRSPPTFQSSEPNIRSHIASQRGGQNSTLQCIVIFLDQLRTLSPAYVATCSIGDVYIRGWRPGLMDKCVLSAKPTSTQTRSS
ncbi:hypothetical protein A6R68_16805 [Neotoma lepida]|uniref:Uncharacterized protein n=1 Tax=Neotoma lepida TaxID=56216 RepID=A0A1A6HDT9_NEOLE|nr:hypothetical protein A6R68_16805 [Neotoma lepida]